GVDGGDEIERLRDANPSGQHRDVGDETDLAHERVALVPRVAPEHAEFAQVRREAHDVVEGGRLPGAVRTNQADDPAFADVKVDAVQGDACAVGLPETLRFDVVHRRSSVLRWSRSIRL